MAFPTSTWLNLSRSMSLLGTFHIPTFRRKQHSGHAICFFAVQIWNPLPFTLGHSPSLPAFKTSLKTYSSNSILTNDRFSAAQILNSLSFSLQHSSFIPAFKTSLQTYLFQTNIASFISFDVFLSHVHACIYVPQLQMMGYRLSVDCSALGSLPLCPLRTTAPKLSLLLTSVCWLATFNVAEDIFTAF